VEMGVEVDADRHNGDYKAKMEKFYDDYIDNSNSVNSVQKYSVRASTYEKEVLALGFPPPMKTASAIVELLGANNNESCSVLDAGCGTGLVAQNMMSMGYKGVVDGFDGASGMVKEASNKNLYRTLKTIFLTEEENRIIFNDGLYDAVVASGVFCTGHIYVNALRDVVKVLKPGGVMVFTSPKSKHNIGYYTKLTGVIDQMEREGIWKKLKIETIGGCGRDYWDDEANVTPGKLPDPVPMDMFCYKKL